MVVIVGAPFAHWMVNASVKFPQYRRQFWYAAAGATALMVTQRLILMRDAGYPLREDKLSSKPKRVGWMIPI
jgi:hypothetical protein